MQSSGGRAFQAAGTAGTKTVRWEHAWHVWAIAKGQCGWVDWASESNMRWGGPSCVGPCRLSQDPLSQLNPQHCIWFPSFKPHCNYFKISNPLYWLGCNWPQVIEKPTGSGSKHKDIYYVLDKYLKVAGPKTCLAVHRCHQGPRGSSYFFILPSSMCLLNVTRWLLQFQASHPFPTASQIEMKESGREKCMCRMRRQEDFLHSYVSYHGRKQFPRSPSILFLMSHFQNEVTCLLLSQLLEERNRWSSLICTNHD